MADLTTSYVGLKLRNPVIVSSSGLADSLDKLKKIEAAGAGALVLKSLFEEQINHEAGRMIGDNSYPEAAHYILNYSKSNTLDKYLDLIENARKEVKIPVFASINCVSDRDWTDFAAKIEEAGADGLELNVFILPVDGESSAKYEARYFKLVEKVRNRIDIPIAVKMSGYFTNILYMVNNLYSIGANAVVLFNRLYEPDINIDEMKMTSAEVFSSPSDLRHSLRWISLVSDRQKDIQLSASTGVHDYKAIIKLLLAGANTVQVCSVLYRHGIEYLADMLQEMESWLDAKGYKSVDEIRGKMNYRTHKDPAIWERSQFMRYFSSRD
jgi:dihydroorotate dehydrogenase (fumarate)